MKKIKHPYQAPKVKVVSFVVEGGFTPSIDQGSSLPLSAHGESNPKYERFEVSFGGNSGNNSTGESHF